LAQADPPPLAKVFIIYINIYNESICLGALHGPLCKSENPPVIYTYIYKREEERGCPLSSLVEICSVNPARIAAAILKSSAIITFSKEGNPCPS